MKSFLFASLLVFAQFTYGAQPGDQAIYKNTFTSADGKHVEWQDTSTVLSENSSTLVIESVCTNAEDPIVKFYCPGKRTVQKDQLCELRDKSPMEFQSWCRGKTGFAKVVQIGQTLLPGCEFRDTKGSSSVAQVPFCTVSVDQRVDAAGSRLKTQLQSFQGATP